MYIKPPVTASLDTTLVEASPLKRQEGAKDAFELPPEPVEPVEPPKPAKKKGRPKGSKHPIKQISGEAITAALKANYGQYLAACKVLGIDYKTLITRLTPEHKAIHDEFFEETTDIAERTLSNAVRKGDNRAIEFWLKMRGRHRGWAERQEVQVSANPDATSKDASQKRASAVAALLQSIRADSKNDGTG